MRISRVFLLWIWLSCAATTVSAAEEQQLAGSLSLSGAWAIYPTAVAWAEAFQTRYPGVKVDVAAGGAGKGAADAISGLVEIGMVSREPHPAELTQGIKALYILHDGVYPVASDKHPRLTELLDRGISREAWGKLYISGAFKNWGELLGGKPAAVHLYTRSDSCGAAAAWAGFLGGKQEDLKGIGVYGDPGLLEAVRRDPLALGYANFSYVFGADGKPLPGLRLVPIDADANGKADAGEVFPDRAAAAAAITSGSYPAARKNYFFIRPGPNPIVRAFITFALSEEGTAIVNQIGASLPLTSEERRAVLAELS